MPRKSLPAALVMKSQRADILRYFRDLVQIDTSNPPGNERKVVEYLRSVLDKEGIPFNRPRIPRS